MHDCIMQCDTILRHSRLILDVVRILLDKFTQCNIETVTYQISSKREPITLFHGHIRVQHTKILQIMTF